MRNIGWGYKTVDKSEGEGINGGSGSGSGRGERKRSLRVRWGGEESLLQVERRERNRAGWQHKVGQVDEAKGERHRIIYLFIFCPLRHRIVSGRVDAEGRESGSDGDVSIVRDLTRVFRLFYVIVYLVGFFQTVNLRASNDLKKRVFFPNYIEHTNVTAISRYLNSGIILITSILL